MICHREDLISLGSYLPDAGLIEGRVALYLAIKCKRSDKELDKEIGTGKIEFHTIKQLINLISNNSDIGGSTLVACYRAINRIKDINNKKH